MVETKKTRIPSGWVMGGQYLHPKRLFRHLARIVQAIRQTVAVGFVIAH